MDEVFQLTYQTSNTYSDVCGVDPDGMPRRWRKGLLTRLIRQRDLESKRVQSDREEAKKESQARTQRERRSRRY